MDVERIPLFGWLVAECERSRNIVNGAVGTRALLRPIVSQMNLQAALGESTMKRSMEKDPRFAPSGHHVLELQMEVFVFFFRAQPVWKILRRLQNQSAFFDDIRARSTHLDPARQIPSTEERLEILRGQVAGSDPHAGPCGPCNKCPIRFHCFRSPD